MEGEHIYTLSKQLRYISYIIICSKTDFPELLGATINARVGNSDTISYLDCLHEYLS